MLRQQLKDAYFAANRVAVLPNTWRARRRYRTPPAEGLRLHVGCGEKYIPGLLNIDGNLQRKVDLWLDLRNPLPFPDQSAQLIYCVHTLEHLFVDEAQRLLKEFHRILRPDGVVRLVTPSFEHAMKIAAGHTAEDPQRSFDFPTGQAIDYLFCDGQHRYAYSHPLMEHFARAAGFTGVEHFDDLSAREYAGITLGPELAGSLLVELRR